MNQVFKSFLDQFVVALTHDISLYVKTLEERAQYLRTIPMVLQKNELLCPVVEVWFLSRESSLLKLYAI